MLIFELCCVNFNILSLYSFFDDDRRLFYEEQRNIFIVKGVFIYKFYGLGIFMLMIYDIKQ